MRELSALTIHFKTQKKIQEGRTARAKRETEPKVTYEGHHNVASTWGAMPGFLKRQPGFHAHASD